MMVLGGQMVGKTSLLYTFQTGRFPGDNIYLPSIMNNYNCNLLVHRTPVNLELWDSVSTECHDRLRPLSYPETDVFLLCFSVSNRKSMEDCYTFKCEVENLGECPQAKFIVVATKIELRHNEVVIEKLAGKGITAVSFDEGHQLALQIGAVGYCECSSRTYKGVRALLYLSIDVAIGNNDGNLLTRVISPKNRCSMM